MIALAALSSLGQCGEYPVKLLPGNPYANIDKSSLDTLTKQKWDSRYELYEENGNDLIEIHSCEELRKSLEDGYYNPMPGEITQDDRRIYCRSISWLQSAKPAEKSAIKFPICIDRKFYITLVSSVDIGNGGDQYWGSTGIAGFVTERCDLAESDAGVEYSQYLQPPNELTEHGTKSGGVSLEFLAQGDFDGDGWLDVIAFLSSGPYLPEGEDYRGSGVDFRIKISSVAGKLTITRFHDGFDY